MTRAHTIYLAGRYDRRDALRHVARQLRIQGHRVTSRWLDTEWNDTGGSTAVPLERRVEFANIDLEDIAKSDCFVAFTERPESGSARGGRHVEFGVALCQPGVRIIIVGPRENLFYYLPNVEQIDDTWQLFPLLGDANPDLR